jgi:hypothetical protein
MSSFPRTFEPRPRALRHSWLVFAVVLGLLSALAPAQSPAKPRKGARGLPDTVLAAMPQVGRQVTTGRFDEAWGALRPPQRPDSLTPESAAGFLDLLIGQELLGAASLEAGYPWTARDSAAYLALVDRLTLSALLDSALAAEAARWNQAQRPIRSIEELGTAVRDTYFVRHPIDFDAAGLEWMADRFLELGEVPMDAPSDVRMQELRRVPEIAPGDSSRVLARTPGGDYTAGELLVAWQRLSPLYRPRIRTPEGAADMVMNGVFERDMRREVVTRRLAERPDIAPRLARARELNAVERYVEHEVYDPIPRDSVTLRRFYDRDPEPYALPLRARAILLEMRQRQDALRMAALLADETRADSLAEQAARRRVNYRVELSADTDSALFARVLAAGPGTVLGPDSTADGGWQVVRVGAMLPGRLRTFEEARERVEQRWFDQEGERRMGELLARLRKATRVDVNRAALAALGSGTPARPRRRRRRPARG